MAKKFIVTLSDTTLFLQQCLFHPRRIGAVIPSSRQLAAAMARWLPENFDRFVLELGPGTGVVTEALLQRGLPQEKLVAIERDPKLAQRLRERFPAAHILTGDAWQLDELLRRRRISSVGAVISSLPLLNFSEEQAETLAEKIRAVLEPQGQWVQFTYRLHNPRPRGAARFRLQASKVVWFNLPPARVSVLQK